MIISLAKRAKQAQEYYFSVKLAEVRQLLAAGHDVINMGIGNPDQTPSEATIDALTKAAFQPNSHGYQSYKGTPALRQSIATWYKRIYGVLLHSETEILPLIGSKEGITHITLTFVDEGDEVLVPELGYPAYRAVSEMAGGKVIEYPLLENQGWQPDWEAMQSLVSSRTKLLWLNYPHMPTGAPATQSLFENAVAFARKNQILLCHDNPYSLILNQKPPISLLSIEGAMNVAIELNSMSKSHNMAGWRVGWLSGAKPYIDAILTIKSNVDSGMFLGIQQAAVAALQNTDEWHLAQNEVYRGRLTAAKTFLNALQCSYDESQEGMFIWAKLPDTIPSADVLVDELLYQKSIFIAPGFIFGPKGQRYIRLSLCMPAERIWEAVQRLEAW